MFLPYPAIFFNLLLSFLCENQPTNPSIHPSIHPPSFFQAGFPLIRSQIAAAWGMQRNKLHSKNPSVLFILRSSTLVNPFCPPHQKKSRGGGGGGGGCLRPRSFLLPPYLFPPPFFLSFLKLRPYSRVQEVGQRLSLRLARTRDTEWKGFSPHKRAR